MTRPLALLITLGSLGALAQDVKLDVPTTFVRGELIQLPRSKQAVSYEGLEVRTPCATPTNCGKGYTPPRPRFVISGCEAGRDCPWALIRVSGDEKQATATVVATSPRQLEALVARCTKKHDCALLGELALSEQLSFETRDRLRRATAPKQPH